MIKITRETELKKGMKIKFHNSIYEINGFGNNMPLDNCIDKDWVRIKCICVPEMNSVKATKLFLIDSNAEIIEEEIKEKVVVNEEVELWDTRVSPWKTIEEEMPPLDKSVLIKMNKEYPDIFWLGEFGRNEIEMLCFESDHGEFLPIEDIEKWMLIPEDGVENE